MTQKTGQKQSLPRLLDDLDAGARKQLYEEAMVGEPMATVHFLGALQHAKHLARVAGALPAARLALAGLLRFMAEKPTLSPYLGQFTTILLALDDLATGVRHPMFDVPGRNRTPTDRLQINTSAAAWSEALIRRGMPPREADARVARTLSRMGYRQPGGRRSGPTQSTIREWRGEVRSSAPSGIDADHHRRMVTALADLGEVPAEQIDRFMQSLLLTRAAHLFPIEEEP